MSIHDSSASPRATHRAPAVTLDLDDGTTQAGMLCDNATAQDVREPLNRAYLRVADANHLDPQDVVDALEAWRQQAADRRRPMLARYEDLGPLGEGGGGEVRLARDRHTNQQVAIKWLHLNRDRPGFSRAFEQESTVPADLGHPNILQVRDRGVVGNRAWIVTSYYPGGTYLEQIRQRRETRPLLPLLHVLVSVAETLAHAHDEGVVHADVKPSNIIIGADGRSIALIDWGLARHRARLGLFRTGGSLHVMSPEQARGEQVWTPAIDVYALGAILCWCVLGHPPIRGPRSEVLERLREGPRAPEIPDLRPGGLAALVRDAMHPDHTQRLPDARAFGRRLSAFLTKRARHDEGEAAVMKARKQIRALGAAAQHLAMTLAETQRLRRVHAGARSPEDLGPLWAAEDASEQATVRLLRMEERAELELRRALSVSPHHREAQATLCELLRESHERATARGDRPRATQLEVRMHALDAPTLAPYLRGEGRLVLQPSRPGMRIRLHPLRIESRRWVEADPIWTGIHRIDGLQLPAGDYLAVLTTADQSVEVRHPISIGRRSGARADEGAVERVIIPPADALGPDEVFITAGEHHTRGRTDRVRTEAFIVRRTHITVGEYLRFLNALSRTGAHELAEASAPREGNNKGPMVFPYRDGRWHPGPDSDGTLHPPTWPVQSISPESARTFLSWLAGESGKPWRLGTQREFDRMARGPFNWSYPWGHQWVPGFAWTREAQGGRPSALADAGKHPVDQSPSGVLDIAGNVCELIEDDTKAAGGGLVVRGGAWAGSETQAHLDWGGTLGAGRVSSWIGLRPYRSAPMQWRLGDEEWG